MGGRNSMKKMIAENLLSIGAVSLQPENPFTWASGIKSPIYCDNRLTLGYPEIRKNIANGLATLIQEQYGNVDVIAGTATAGIAHAAWVSDLMNLPMCYVRSSAKGHGKGNQIEGLVKAGQKVVIVEDLISTGGSVITCVDALREAGCEVVGVVSIFTYNLPAAVEKFKANDVTYHSLTDYDTLVQVAKEKGTITETDVNKLTEWRKNPQDSSWMNAQV